MEWLETHSADELVFIIWGAVFVLWATWKFLKTAFPGVKRFISFVDALMKLPDFMADTTDRLTKNEAHLSDVKHEVLPNNGASMRDEQVTLGIRIERIEARHKGNDELLQALDDELRMRGERGIGIPRSTISPRLNAMYLRKPTAHDEVHETGEISE